MKEMQKQFGYYLDIRNPDVDLDTFAQALAIERVTRLLAFGGASSGLPDPESALLPEDLRIFLTRAVADAERAGRFVDEWRGLAGLVPLVTSAWELGHSLFHSDLAQAQSDRESQEYFRHIEFATEFAWGAARKSYERDKTMRAWLVNGYLRAWREHFFPMSDSDSSSE